MGIPDAEHFERNKFKQMDLMKIRRFGNYAVALRSTDPPNLLFLEDEKLKRRYDACSLN